MINDLYLVARKGEIKKIMKKDYIISEKVDEIKNNGYCILENYITEEGLDTIKNSLLKALHYIEPTKEKDLQKKYYQIKKFNEKLKGNWYDIAGRDINLLQFLHSPVVTNIVKKYFDTDVLFSGRSCIGVYDDDNDKLLEPHQETAQLSRDCMLFWCPLYDTDKDKGGLFILKDSHKHGYFNHTTEHPDGKKGWTNLYTHVDRSISKKFKKVELEVKAGSAVLMHSSTLHGGYPNKTKGSVRITVCERYCPLQKMPYLKNPKAPLKIPYTGVDYNKILD